VCTIRSLEFLRLHIFPEVASAETRFLLLIEMLIIWKDVSWNIIRLSNITLFVEHICNFVLFLLAIVLSVLLRFTNSDYPLGIFKLLMQFG